MYTDTGKVNIILLNEKWIKREIKKESLKTVELNESENITEQKFMGLRGKLIALSAYIRTLARSYINSLMIHLETMGNQEQMPIKSKQGEIIKIKAEVNDTKIKIQNPSL